MTETGSVWEWKPCESGTQMKPVVGMGMETTYLRMGVTSVPAGINSHRQRCNVTESSICLSKSIPTKAKMCTKF